MDDHTVVGGVLSVIDAVADRGRYVSFAELVAVTGIPAPTLFRIAATRVARNLLRRTDRCLAVGPELSHLGEKAARRHDFER